MNTARDLAITVLSAPDREVGQGDLSLALAGAEVLDLVEARAVVLDGERLVPVGGPATGEGLLDEAGGPATGDRLLGEAAAALVRQAPYEPVEEWLWRRGHELSRAYTAELARNGVVDHIRGSRLLGRNERTVVVDSPVSRAAAARRGAGEPVLTALATAVGLQEDAEGSAGTALGDGDVPGAGGDVAAGASSDTGMGTGMGLTDDESVVLAAVGDAVMELEAVRQRRSIERAAFDNVWRGL